MNQQRSMWVENFPHTPLEANNTCPEENQVNQQNHEVADKTPKHKPWPNAETNVPPWLSAKITKKEQLH